MKLLIARDLGGRLSLHYEQPTYIANRGWNKVWAIPDSSIFPEVTFENSPQMVEINEHLRLLAKRYCYVGLTQDNINDFFNCLKS